MLCGASPLSFRLAAADTRPPYLTLLTLCQGMAAITAPDDDDIYLENGLLSYENPNYHLDPARLDDALNSNTDDLYDDIYQELDAVCNRTSRSKSFSSTGGGLTPGRRVYKNLDVGTMGVDVTGGYNYNTRGNETTDTTEVLDNDNANLGMGRRPLDLTTTLRSKPDLIETVEQREKSGNLNNTDSEITHISGQLNNDLYALPLKCQSQTTNNDDDYSKNEPSSPDSESFSPLPTGWEKHEDNDGPYYWHIKSGTIQREPPVAPPNGKSEPRRPFVKCAENILSDFQPPPISSVTRSNTSSALEELDGKKKEERKEELALKRRSYPARPEPESTDRPIRFAVRSLGWVEIAEEDLTPERSSKAVNKCIVDLSLGRNDLLDVVGRWGDGKDLFMDLDEGALKLIDPENLTVLNTQPIHTIRVWGVGRDNGRDFAYVARDRTTRKHMCHVFRCDIPARTIANTLRDICKKIMIERSLQQNLAKPIDITCSSGGGKSGLTRPTNLPTEHRRFHHRNGQALVAQSFPTPMEEPKKILQAEYLGSLQVTRATGMDILNDAIDHMTNTVPREKWKQVSVAVAPSMISITYPNDENKSIAECRVRYLSFLGIGRNVKHCGFIMHTAQDLFIAHVFYCEPSSGALCKTIEAACKLRYQKCLDAHPQGLGRGQSTAPTPNRGIGATLKSLVGSLTGRKLKGSES